jgi:hypothetical protein
MPRGKPITPLEIEELERSPSLEGMLAFRQVPAHIDKQERDSQTLTPIGATPIGDAPPGARPAGTPPACHIPSGVPPAKIIPGGDTTNGQNFTYMEPVGEPERLSDLHKTNKHQATAASFQDLPDRSESPKAEFRSEEVSTDEVTGTGGQRHTGVTPIGVTPAATQLVLEAGKEEGPDLSDILAELSA